MVAVANIMFFSKKPAFNANHKLCSSYRSTIGAILISVM